MATLDGHVCSQYCVMVMDLADWLPFHLVNADSVGHAMQNGHISLVLMQHCKEAIAFYLKSFAYYPIKKGTLSKVFVQKVLLRRYIARLCHDYNERSKLCSKIRCQYKFIQK